MYADILLVARIGEPITVAALLPRGPLVVFVQVARNANPIQVIVIIAIPASASWFEMVNAKGLSAADSSLTSIPSIHGVW